jgi:hypothetical protein
LSPLFRKEAMERRSRALFGEVILRGPLPGWAVAGLMIAVLGLIGFVLFGINVGDQTVWSWLRE